MVGLNQMVFLIGVIAFSSLGYAAESGLRNPRVTFTATGAAGLKVVGTGRELVLEAQGQTLVFRVPLRSIGTGIGMRDRQMRDKYLEVESYPFVELRMARDALNLPVWNGATTGDAKARLTMHGKVKDTNVHYTIRRQGQWVDVTGTFRVDMRAHGIDLPSHRGLTLNPEVDVEVSFGALDRAVVADAPSE
jgi:hypothetical protein